MKHLIRMIALGAILSFGIPTAPLAGTSGCGSHCEYIANGCHSDFVCSGLIVCASNEDGCEFCDWNPKCVEDPGECWWPDEPNRIVCEVGQT